MLYYWDADISKGFDSIPAVFWVIREHSIQYVCKPVGFVILLGKRRGETKTVR